MPRGWVISSRPLVDDRPHHCTATRLVRYQLQHEGLLGSGCRWPGSSLTKTSTKTLAHSPCSQEQLCPQESPVAPCHPPCPRHPSCLLQGNLPSDPVQAVLHFLRRVEHQAGGREELGRVESCGFAMTLPLPFFQLPLCSLGRLWGLCPGQGTRAVRTGTCRTLSPRDTGLTVPAMAPSSQRPELLK